MRLDEIKSKKVEEKDEGKHNNGKTTGFKAVAKNAAKEYGSKEAGNRVAGAIKAKMAAKGELEEGHFDDMVNDLGKDSEKGPGRHPGAKERIAAREKPGVKTVTPTGVKHSAGDNYSGKGYNTKDGGSRTAGIGPRLLLPTGGKHGGSSSSRLR